MPLLHPLPRSSRAVAFLAISPVFLLLLACFGAADVTTIAGNTLPRWACPTPTALPPVQVAVGTATNPSGTPVPVYRDTEPYEREPYNQIGKQPILRPTPYAKTGTSFFLGQIVNVTNQLDVQVTGTAQDVPFTQGSDGARQLFLLKTTWHNRGAALMFDAARQMVLTGIKRPDGRLSVGQWRWDTAAAEAAALPAGGATLRTEIATGVSEITLPVLAPAGAVQSVDLQLDPPGTTQETLGSLRLQFVRSDEPKCEHDGTIAAVYEDGAPDITAPPIAPGTDKIVAAALAQIGRQYCWGGKGYAPCNGYGGGPRQVTPACTSFPCWDCSGLTWGAYNANGIVIGHGTSNQKNYPAVPVGDIQPGDLLLFGGINQQGRSATITHVGLYAGDIDGDGTGDMIHAANYPTGVVVAKNVLGNTYYLQRLAIVTRPPRGGA